MWCSCCHVAGDEPQQLQMVSTLAEAEGEESDEEIELPTMKEPAGIDGMKGSALSEVEPEKKEDFVPASKPQKESEEKIPPTATYFEFTVNVKKKDGKLGCTLETLFADYCIVRKVQSDGAMKDMMPFDRIMKVNAVSCKASALAKLMSENDSMELLIQRPRRIEVSLEKSQCPVSEKNTCGAVITAVEGKGIDGNVKQFDRICAIDGNFSVEAVDLRSALDSVKTPVTMTVCSYS